MARRRTSARRYAEALFQLAERDGQVEPWLEQLDRAAEMIGRASPGVLENPAIPYATREEALSGALVDASPQVRNLVLLLLKRGRTEQLVRVAAEFRRLHQRRSGIVTATITSAAPLEPREVDEIRSRLEGTSGARVELTQAPNGDPFLVDPALLGGLVVRIGDRLMDGSVRGRLERLRQRLAATAY